MKVAVVDPAAYSLPYDDALCAALGAAGMDVTLFTTRFAHGEMPEPQGYRIVEHFYRRRVPGVPRRVSRGLQHAGDVRRLRRVLAREGFDVAHLQWPVLDRVDRPAWRKIARRVATVLTLHNAVPRADARPLDCETARAFDAVVAHSTDGAANVRERCGLDVDRVWHVVHGALEQYAVAPTQTPPVELGDGPVVALPGLLRAYKGVDVLLAAWPAVRARVPGAQLVVAGRPMGIELPAPMPEGAHAIARFLDTDEFAWVLDRADVVCLPYTSIDNSGVLFAAMAAGKPLLLSDVGGFTEFVGSGAALAPPGDPAGLADALVDLLGDPARREALGREARAAADRRFAWSTIAGEYARHYAELVARRRA